MLVVANGRPVTPGWHAQGVRWRFGPDDEDAFEAARDDVAASFEATPAGRDRGWIAGQVCHFKWGYLDGDLARWTAGDVEEILLDLFPAKVALDPDDRAEVPAALAAFLRHLGDRGVVAAASAEAAARVAETLAADFREAAADERRWGFGKRLWSEAADEGVDLTDPAVVEAFIADFNERPLEERDTILGLGPVPPPGPPVFADLPVMALPPRAQLQEAAERAPWTRWLTGLVGYVGDGLALTQKGNLKLADAKALVDTLGTGDVYDEAIGDRVFKTKSATELPTLDLVLELAVTAGLLERSTRLRPGPDLGALDDPLDTVMAAWVNLVTVCGPTEHWYRDNRYGFGWYAEVLDEQLLPLCVALANGPIPIDAAAGQLWDVILEEHDLPDVDDAKLDFHRESVTFSLRRALDILSDIGVVAVTGVDEVASAAGLPRRQGGQVELTDLGRWAVQRLAALLDGRDEPGALADVPTPELLRRVGDLPEDLAAVEVDQWLAARDTTGPAELVAAIVGADVVGRSLALAALARLDPPAVDAVATLADDPQLEPLVTVWAAAVIGDDSPLAAGDDPERVVALLAAAADLWGDEEMARRWVEPVAGPGLLPLLDRLWRVPGTDTERVLAALGGSHPDTATAKAARKALFKHRSKP